MVRKDGRCGVGKDLFFGKLGESWWKKKKLRWKSRSNHQINSYRSATTRVGAHGGWENTPPRISLTKGLSYPSFTICILSTTSN